MANTWRKSTPESTRFVGQVREVLESGANALATDDAILGLLAEDAGNMPLNRLTVERHRLLVNTVVRQVHARLGVA